MPAHAPDRVFAALADPTRCRVVERLGLAPATAGEIAAQLPVSRQAVVKHLAVLEAAGLAEGTREGRRVVYRLTPGQFAAAARWMGDVGAAWDRRLAALAARILTRIRPDSAWYRAGAATREGAMGFKVVVDFDKCESNALCMGVAPEVFEVRDDDFLYVLQEEPPDELKARCEEAARVCPKQAITIQDL